MLALATGWTPDVLADLPERFRRACHWALYAQAVVGPEGLPTITVPHGAPLEERARALRAMAAIDQVRRGLFPDGD